MPRVIGLGDKTTTGGVVVECYPDVQLNNQGTTVIGMKATCPACKVGIGAIVPMKAIKVVINNIQVAIEGDWVQCGCPPKSNILIGSPASYVVADDQGAVSMKMPFLSQEHAEQTYQTFSEVASGNKSITELFATVANTGADTDDWKPVPGSYPVEIFHTRNSLNDKNADDLKSGDLSYDEIIKLGQIKNFAISQNEMLYPPYAHFAVLRAGAFIVAWGEYAPIITKMIDHFEQSSGSLFTDPLLDKALKTHARTARFNSKVSELISNHLSNQLSVTPEIKDQISSVLRDPVKGVSLPKFADDTDAINGLGIAVHDVHALKVDLVDLEYKGNQFRGTLRYKAQDHFGLDKADVNGGKLFEFAPPFRSWFLLQRYEKYAFKPFINEMNFDLKIEGTF